MTLML